MKPEKQRDIDLVMILDNPSEFSEEELQRFFANEENRLEYIAVRRAQQAVRREEATVPDTDELWERFVRSTIEQINEPERHLHRYTTLLKYMIAVLSGAAAMLLFVIAYNYFTEKEGVEGQLVVMEYDESPQNLTMLIDGKNEQTIKPQDSISFFKGVQGKKMQEMTFSNNTRGANSSIKQKDGMRTLKTPRGMDLKVILPDGSEVWLNAESSLEFPTSFANARNVVLNGEAYFKVAHNESSPFIVSTNKMNVKVLGTEFNFRNYPTECTQVALVKGSVEILNADNTSTSIVIYPGQGANIDKEGRINVHAVDTYAAIQWTEGFFYFQNQTLVTALQEIGRWYNVGVVFENTECLNEKIHFSALRKETLQQTLDKLNKLLHTNITAYGKNIIVR